MTKSEFLALLSKGLHGLPQQDIEERLTFYGEMIDDRIEEGLSEEEAVSAVGSVEKIVEQTIADIPFTRLAKEKIKPKKSLKVWEIVLLVLGSPIWLSLILAAAAVLLSLYVVLWAVIICLWAAFASAVCCALGGVASGVVIALKGNALSGIAMMAEGIVCAGLSIFIFYACKTATKGVLILTKKIAVGIKSCFIKKEEA